MQQPYSVHNRVMRLLQTHSTIMRRMAEDHNVLILDPQAQRRRIEQAHENFVQNQNSITQRSILSSTESSLEHFVNSRFESNTSILSRTSTRKRPHILGFERAVIYKSNLKAEILSKAYHCNITTIYRIKADPISVLGMTRRQFKSLISDLIDSNLMNWFTDISGCPEFVLPPLDFVYRGGSRRKLSQEHTSILRVILEINPSLFLDEILEILTFYDPFLDISMSTLSRHLLIMGYKKKKSSKVIGDSNPVVRQHFALSVSELVQRIDQLVFLDEATNARDSLTRSTSRSANKTSARGKRHRPTQRVSFIGAIATPGIVAFDLYPGTISSAEFLDFMVHQLLPSMNRYPGERSVLILDNARAHSTQIVDFAFQHFGVMVIFLPPYSPDLNPIERFFSSIKASFKRFVGSDPSLRQNPYLLWLMSIAHCDQVVDYRRLINSTYDDTNLDDTIHVHFD